MKADKLIKLLERGSVWQSIALGTQGSHVQIVSLQPARNDMKFYIASPIGEPNSLKRQLSERAKEILSKQGEVYAPWDYKIPNAWDYSNQEWGLMVFTNDVYALDHSDWIVVLSYGRIETTVGTAWEAGYAFAKGKKVLVVEVDEELSKSAVQSLMMSNGCFACIRGLRELEKYDFKNPVELRTTTEQK